MENFKNIITLLNSQETREVGAVLAVSQGLEKKVLAFYERIRGKGNRKYHFCSDYENQTAKIKRVKRFVKKSRVGTRYFKLLNIIISIRDAMHDKEVFELVQSGKMRESDRLPF